MGTPGRIRSHVTGPGWCGLAAALLLVGCGGAKRVEETSSPAAHPPAPAPQHARLAHLEASVRASLLADGAYRPGDAHPAVKQLLLQDGLEISPAPNAPSVFLDPHRTVFVNGDCGEQLGYLGFAAWDGDEERLDYLVLARKGASGWGIERVVLARGLDHAVYGRFADQRCELAVLRWKETKATDAEEGACKRDYSVVVVNPLAETVRSVSIGSLPCPEDWWKCGPTPVCEPGASSGTRWRVDLDRPFPIQESGRDGLMIRVADPEGGQLRFYGLATEKAWLFGSRRADYTGVRARKIELLTCDDWRGARVVGTVAGRLVDYDEPPTLGLSCARFALPR